MIDVQTGRRRITACKCGNRRPHPSCDTGQAPPPVVVIASDLHLADASGPRARSECSSDAVTAFIRCLHRHRGAAGSGALLVLNGDTFDFLRIRSIPRSDADLAAWSALLPGRLRPLASTASVTRHERLFGLGTQVHKSIWKLHAISRAHPGFFAALGEWVRHGGSVLIIAGNHDCELEWPDVRKAVLLEMLRHLNEPASSLERLESRVAFATGAVRVGNIWVEHGHRGSRLNVGATTLADITGQRLRLPLTALASRYLVAPIEAACRPHARGDGDARGADSAGGRALPLQRAGTALVATGLAGLAAPDFVGVGPISLAVLMLLAFMHGPGVVGSLLRALHHAADAIIAWRTATYVVRGARLMLNAACSHHAHYRSAYAIRGHSHVPALEEMRTGQNRACYVNTGSWHGRNCRGVRDGAHHVYRFAKFYLLNGEYVLCSLKWEDKAYRSGFTAHPPRH